MEGVQYEVKQGEAQYGRWGFRRGKKNQSPVTKSQLPWKSLPSWGLIQAASLGGAELGGRQANKSCLASRLAFPAALGAHPSGQHSRWEDSKT